MGEQRVAESTYLDFVLHQDIIALGRQSKYRQTRGGRDREDLFHTRHNGGMLPGGHVDLVAPAVEGS